MPIIVILLKASLLLLAVLLAYAVLRKRLSATSRHFLWTLAIAGLLVLPVLQDSLPPWTVATVTPSRPSEIVPMADSAVTRSASEVTSSVSPPAGPGDKEFSGVSGAMVALVVYGVGLLAFLLRLVAQRWSVRRLARRATRVTDPAWTALLNETIRRLNLRRPIILLRSLEETMPMAFGTRRPAIFLPALADSWSEDQRRSVLLHELAHVARHDCLTQSLAAVACAIYWVHPGVWWIARRLRIERELACDDRVLAAGADADHYASQLLEFAYSLRVETAPALVVTMAAPGSLEERLRALVDAGRNRRMPLFRSRVAATAFAVLLVGATGAARLGEMVPLLPIQDPPRQSFEVASVKPNNSPPETGGFIQRMRGGTFNAGNQTLIQLIRFAYDIQPFQLVGAPGWMSTERFDITAKAPADIPEAPGQPSPEAVMLRSLLEDRFRMSVRREIRDLPIYALVIARADGRLGPRLRRPASDFCTRRAAAADKGINMPPPAGTVCGIRGNSNELTAGSFPIAGFARFLGGESGRLVVDRTGLSGEWDFDLKWSAPSVPNPDPDHPVIFTALQEQLGLRLEATNGPVDALVIDRVEPLIPD
jgi:uncharacterized protein (TIGR03435 family)